MANSNFPSSIHNSWHEYIDIVELDKIKKELNPVTICPEAQYIFREFSIPVEELRVIIIGESPYPKRTDACGRAFATPDQRDKDFPFSLQIICKALSEYIGIEYEDFSKKFFDTTLQAYSSDGIMMLNSALTCEINSPGCHNNLWKNFTQTLIKRLCKETNGLIFWLIGNEAKSLSQFITNRHWVFESIHPAALKHNPSLIFDHKFKEIDDIYVKLYGHYPTWDIPF